MKFKSYTGITWSVLELTGLLEDEDSLVYLEKFKKHLGLHPFHLTNLTAALNEILSSNLNFYDTELKGFVLAYKNPKLLTPLGEIVYDTCFIHVDIEADFYVFRPEVGSSLKGIVNKKGRDHIGVLVHKAFNVSIPKPDNEEDWVGENLEIGQEVRFTITLLDLTSKLPFIRAVLKPNDYLQGCKLTEKAVNRCNNKNVQNNVDKGSRKSTKQSNRHTFFENDSENTSAEDASQTKKERVKHKKLNKKLEEEVIEHIEKEKKDKKHTKKVKEFEECNSIDEKTVSTEYTNGKFTNNEELEESVSSKSKFKKKSKSRSSQNYIDTDSNEESEKYLSQEMSERLSDVESKDKISKVKLKQNRTSKNSESTVEDDTFESKVKVKKNSKKRKDFDDTDNSTDEFSSYKYIQHSAIKNLKSSPIETEKMTADIKMEKLNDTNRIKSEIKSPKKKRHMGFETFESDVDRKSEEILLKGKSKKSRTSDSKFTIENMKIKKERVISGSEDTEDEDYIKSNKVSRMDSKLNMSAHSSNYNDSVEEDESGTKKKQKKQSKNKLKVKSEFGDVTVEKSDDENEDTYHEDNKNNLSNIKSPKKKHKLNNLANSIDSDETDTKNNVKYSNKLKTTDRDIRIHHNLKVEVESPGSDSDDIVYSSQNHKEKFKCEKISSKSKHSESDLDFDNVQIKTEICSAN